MTQSSPVSVVNTYDVRWRGNCSIYENNTVQVFTSCSSPQNVVSISVFEY